MPEQFKKQEEIAEKGESPETIKLPEQGTEANQLKNQEQVVADADRTMQKTEQTEAQIDQMEIILPERDKAKLEKIKFLSPKEQIKALVAFALDKKEKGGPQRVIEIAAGLNNPNVLDGVRDELAKKINELVAEKKIKEI